MNKEKEACECSDNKEERKKQVRAALYGAWYETDADRDYAIDSFTKSTLSIEEISSIVESLKKIPGSIKDRKAHIFGLNDKVPMSGGGIA